MSTEPTTKDGLADAIQRAGLNWVRGAARDQLEAFACDLLAERERATGWQPIKTAPKDGSLFLSWSPATEGLSPLFSLCSWHPDAGFCVDEIRSPSHWMPLLTPSEPGKHLKHGGE